MVRMDELHLLDEGSDKHVNIENDGRVIIVGDIHGCCDELRDLLKVCYREGDTLILAGDLVNKGPKSVEVVRLARELGALAVIGNHDLSSLRGQNARAGGERPDQETAYEWTDGLSEDDLKYIRRLPFTISIPRHNAMVVHAGLVPGIPLESQDPVNMACMRNLLKIDLVGANRGSSGYVTSEKDVAGSLPWASLWVGPTHIYFGHDAKRRLQQYRFATGLDTGCVYGDRLTAAILERGKLPQLVSVPARQMYVNPAARQHGPSRGAPRALAPQHVVFVLSAFTAGIWMLRTRNAIDKPGRLIWLGAGLAAIASMCRYWYGSTG